MMKFPSVLKLIVFIAILGKGECVSVAVSSEGGPSLEEYLCNGTLNSNTTLVLSAGEHHIPPGRSCRVSNLTNIGISGVAAELTTVQCHGDGGFEFAAVTNLTIQNVTFLGCGQTRDDIEGLYGLLEPTRVVLLLKSVVHVSLVQVSVNQFTGIGLYGCELTDAFLNEVEFSGCYSNCSGAVFYQAQSQTSGESTLRVDACNFTDLVYKYNWIQYSNLHLSYISAGLTLWNQGVVVNNSLFSNNSAQLGSALIGIGSDCQLTNTTVVSNFNSGSDLLLSYSAVLITGDQWSLSIITVNILESVFRSNVGGAIAVYSIAVTVAITRCLFYNNSANYGGAMSAIGKSGTITVSQSHFYNNKAVIGGALAYYLEGRATIRNSSFESNNASQLGGAIYVINLERIDVIGTEFKNNSADATGGGIVAYNFIDSTLAINNCTFTGNSAKFGGAIFKFQLSNAFMGNTENGVTVLKSNFSSNDAFVGAAIYAGSFDDTYSQKTFSLNLSGVLVCNNRCNSCRIDPDKDIQGATIYANQVNNIDVSESEFYSNSPNGAIEIRGGKLHFYGTITFKGNTGDDGGAVSLAQNSKLYFHENCYVMFIENNATRVGGAIYVDGDSRQSSTLSRIINNNTTYSFSLCSIQFVGNNAKTLFSNNTAQEAGNSVYATPIYNCWLQQSYSPPSLDDYMRLFGIRERNEIASFPVTVEFGPSDCEQGTKCNYSSDGRLNIISYPGKAIRFRTRALDLANVSSPSLVYATMSSDLQFKVWLGIQEYVSWVNKTNSTLEYHVYGPENTRFDLLLSTSRGNVPKIVSVTLLPCGLGFSHNADNSLCVCSKPYQNAPGVSCNIADGTLSRTTQWLGVYNDTSALVRTCPFMYCRENGKDNFTNLTSEMLRNYVICSGNRTGPLCGKCKEGFSLGFGSSNCVDYCAKTWLAYILLYSAMGPILVIFLFVLNLTVTQGTLYGLIFYANVVIGNRDVLLSNSMQSVAAVFYIITLDLGFIGQQPLCFLANMDQVTKTGLQFVFPVYLVLIVCVVYLICKYCCSYTTGIEHGSMKGSRLNSIGQFIGGRVTSVIATLLYLSYSSLWRTVIEILSPAEIMSETSNTTVWKYDGSVTYSLKDSDSRYKGLFAIAIVFLILLLVYTGILILMPLADLFSGKSKFLLCISLVFNRHLKPFADACYSPFKGKWRVWLGLRLCVLVILYSITASFGSDNPTLVFLLHSVIMTALISLQAYIKPLCTPYTNDDKGRMYNCLDLFYQLDYLMIVLCAWYYYQCENNKTCTSKSKDNVTTLLLSLAIVAVILTLLYHVMFKLHEKIATKFSSILNKSRGTPLLRVATEPATATDVPLKPVSIIVLGDGDLREPLIEGEV